MIFSKLSKIRGQDGMGFLADVGDTALVYKDASKPSKSANALKIFLGKNLNPPQVSADRYGYIGHNRLVTNGLRHLYDDSQPILLDQLIGFHVGILLPTERPKIASWGNSSALSGSDSKFLFSLMAKNDILKMKDHEYLRTTFDNFKGNYSVAISCPALPIITLASNCGSLFLYKDPISANVAFASEKSLLKSYIKKSKFFDNPASDNISQLINKIAYINLENNLDIEIIDLKSTHRQFNGIDNSSFKLKRKIISNQQIDRDRFVKIQRCTKCILPATYPFISFDHLGVCNFCNDYKKQKVLGEEKLNEILSKYRSKTGEPDCLVGLSGGRDSSYGLHILKTKFGMNPVAYTYDWGLTSEKSRKNQALLCGKLGVEHVIRAADIEKKRRYVRMNIEAWLKKPHLGMVPIIQAGDKDFIKFAEVISKEMELSLSIHCNGYSFEQREFFLGFAGINQKLEDNQDMTTYDISNKLRMFF